MSQTEAERIEAEGRREYGHPLENFTRITGAAKALELEEGNPLHHALYMIVLKIARLVNDPFHDDSVLDIKGYATTYEMMLEKLREQDNASS
jgi:hypothetical protein